MKINSYFKVDVKQNVIFDSSDIKLVISDLDGTLLSSNGTLPAENLKAIKELQNAGILFSIASGRHDEMCKTYINQCNINIPTISSNGALIRNPVSSKVIYKNILDMNSAIKILDFCKDHNLDYMAYTLDNVYFAKESNRIKKFYRYNTIAINNNINPMKLSFYNNNHKDIAECGILKILLCSDSSDPIKKVANYLDNLPLISYILSEENTLDISSNNTSKGAAVKILSEHLNIPLSNVCVFGDYTNDISMFNVSGLSFAMDNSHPEVRQAATFVTDTNYNLGVSKAIYNHILNA